MTTLTLPFPPSGLSGHNTGNRWAKSALIKKHRQWAHDATLAAKPSVPATGDIRVSVRFIPPDNRSDRANFPNRCKPYFDGIADALKVNDKRFVPAFTFAEPEKPGRVEVTLTPLDQIP